MISWRFRAIRVSCLGLDVMRIITEVTGILVAHKQDKTINHNGFLCDVGATTCKLTIYQLDDGIIEVRRNGMNLNKLAF